MLGSSGAIKFVILVEDFDTGGTSSITVRKKYLLGFQYVGKLVWETNEADGKSITLFVLFIIWCFFHCRWMRAG